ncbi:MAG TPA: ABC transporter substrate-binding protein [Stellaceae bacterium]|jgi:ABC-type nitrate/sulfonate/bicarbonate transport system substrate-binding protein|nr:ABC transporter substrate-binding protein [Stellaceae bacterium]
MTIRSHTTALAVSAALGAAVAAQPAHAADLMQSTMAIPVTSLGFMMEFVAEDMHFYEKHGVAMKTTQINGLGSINALIAGSVDFAQPSGVSLTRAASKGQNLLAIVQLTDRIVVQVVLRKEIAEAGHFDPKAPLAKRAALLKGHTIAVDSINSIIDAYLGLLAKQGGFTHDDMHVAPMEPPEMISAFAAKRIDGFAMSLPWTLEPVIEGTAVKLASGPDGDTIGLDPFTNTVVAAKPETCEKKPQLCEAVGQAFKETSAWMHEHPDDAEALLKKRFATLDPKVFHASFETELKITPNPPVPTAKGIENTDNYNIEAGLMKPSEKRTDYTKLFTDKYVK